MKNTQSLILYIDRRLFRKKKYIVFFGLDKIKYLDYYFQNG